MRQLKKQYFLKTCFSNIFVFAAQINIAAIFLITLSSCNPSFQAEEEKIEAATEQTKGAFQLRLSSSSNQSRPIFHVTGDLLLGQKIRLYTGVNCQTPRDVKTVTNRSSIQLYSAPLINNGQYTFKIRVESRGADLGPCLPSQVVYNFSNGYKLPPPSLSRNSSNVDRKPTISTTGGQAGTQVEFYTDSSCSSTSYIGSTRAGSNGEAVFNPSFDLSDGVYNFYARTTVNGELIQCSNASDTYTIDSVIKEPKLAGGINSTDSKNEIEIITKNNILGSKVYLYENDANCSGVPFFTSAAATSDTMVVNISEVAGSYFIDTEKTYQFNFAQEISPGSGPFATTPCSTESLSYTYNITPQNFSLDSSYLSTTNNKFSPAFTFENLQPDSSKASIIFIYRNNNCAGVRLTQYATLGNSARAHTLTSDPDDNSLVLLPDATYSYSIKQRVNGLLSNCSNSVDYTINTTPILELAPEVESISSNPLPKFILKNISPDKEIELFENNNCNAANLISSGDYAITDYGSYLELNFSRQLAVTASPRLFTIQQKIEEGASEKTSSCSAPISYHVNSNAFNLAFATGQSATTLDSTPHFKVSNSLDNSEIQIFQDATDVNCTNSGASPDETFNTGTASSVEYEITTPLVANTSYKYYFREYLDLGGNDYLSGCESLTINYDSAPKALKVITSTNSNILRPQFQVENIDNPANHELRLSDDQVCADADDIVFLASTDLFSDNRWKLTAGQNIPSEGQHYFYIRNTLTGDCSNPIGLTFSAAPNINLANGSTQSSNDYKPNIEVSNLGNDFLLRIYRDDSCVSSLATTFDYTSDSAPSYVNYEVDLSSVIFGAGGNTTDGSFPISAQLVSPASGPDPERGFTCRTFNYLFDGKIEQVKFTNPSFGSTKSNLNPTMEFTGLIDSSQVQVFTDLADCTNVAGPNEITPTPAVTNASGDPVEYSFDYTQDLALVNPVGDTSLDFYARQTRGNYISSCTKTTKPYFLTGAPSNLILSTESTTADAPYFGTLESYTAGSEVALEFYTTSDCSGTQIPGSDGLDIPGVRTDKNGFLVDNTNINTPFKRSGEYHIYAKVYRDGAAHPDFTGTYRSDCSLNSLTYDFNGTPKNVRFADTSIITGANVFESNPIDVISTTTPIFIFDNLIHPNATITMHIDLEPTTRNCEATSPDVNDASFTGQGYQVAAGAIPSDGTYSVYFKQSYQQYNSTGPLFDCSDSFTFEVAGVPTDINLIGTSSPSNNTTPSIMAKSLGDDLHARIIGVRSDLYDGTPSSICADTDAVIISDYIDTDIADDGVNNVLNGPDKETTMSVRLNNTLLIEDATFYLAVQVVGEDAGAPNIPDPAISDVCLSEKIDYTLEATPTSISIISDPENDNITNQHIPTFSFTNRLTGTALAANHEVRVFTGNGDAATAKSDCDADTGSGTNYYATNNGGDLSVDQINGAAQFTSDGFYAIYFKQFHAKAAGAADNFASDCVSNSATASSSTYSFQLNGKIQDAKITDPATQPSTSHTLKFEFRNFLKTAGRNLLLYESADSSEQCQPANLVHTFADTDVTDEGGGVYSVTTPTLNSGVDNPIALSDNSLLNFYFKQAQDSYSSDCSVASVTYQLQSLPQMVFEKDISSPSDKDFLTSDPTADLLIDMNSIIDDSNNTLEFYLDASCSGTLFDSVADPHNAPRVSITGSDGSLALNTFSSEGYYTIYARQVLSTGSGYTSGCSGPHIYSLYLNRGGASLDTPVSFALRPEFSVVTQDDNLNIKAYLNDNTCSGTPITTKSTTIAGTYTVDNIYINSDNNSHQFFFQFDNGIASPGVGSFLGNCFGGTDTLYSMNQSADLLEIIGDTTSNTPTPTIEVSGVIEEAGRNTLISLYKSENCNSTDLIYTKVALPAEITGGQIQITLPDTFPLPHDGLFSIYATIAHDDNNDGSYDTGVEYISGCSSTKASYYLEGTPSSVVSVEGDGASNNNTPHFTLDNILSTNQVDAFTSKVKCESGTDPITLSDINSVGNTREVELTFADDHTYKVSFRQSIPGKYQSNCSEEVIFELDRRPSSIALNNASNVLEPVFDIGGTSNNFTTVELYTSHEDGGDGCDIKRGELAPTGASTTVTAATTPLDRDGSYKFYAKMIAASGDTACSDVYATYNLDNRPNNIAFPDGNPGKSINPKVTVSSLLADSTLELFYINDSSIYTNYTADLGCPDNSYNSNIIDLGSFVADGSGDITAQSLPIALTPDSDNTYPIYGYQKKGDFESKCNFLGNYVIDIKPTFASTPIDETHGKSDIINVNLENLIGGATVQIFINGCDAGNEISLQDNIASGLTDSFEINLNQITGGISDNQDYRIFAKQTFNGFSSSCSSGSNILYSFNSAPIVKAINSSSSLKRPTLTVSEILDVNGTTPNRALKIYAIPEGSSTCNNNYLVFDETITFPHANVTKSGTLLEATIDLSDTATWSSARAITADGNFTFRVVQNLDSGNTSGCYSVQEVEHTITSKPTLYAMDPTTRSGNSSSPKFDLTDNQLVSLEGYTINAWINDTNCTAGNESVIGFNDVVDGSTANSITLADEYYSNYVLVSFKYIDPADEHTTLCSAPIIYDYKGLELDLLTPSPDPNDDLSPEVLVTGAESGDIVRLYKDATCSQLIATKTAETAEPLTVETLAFTSDGVFQIYATKETPEGKTSHCSLDYVTYEIDVNPSSITLNGVSAVDVDSTPTISLTGLLDNAQINLYRDENCTILSSISSTSSGIFNIDITSDEITENGAYEFHVTQSKLGFTSSCSSSFVSYTLLTEPGNLSLLQNNPSSDARPQVRVEGVPAASLVRIFKDESDGGDSCDTEIGNASAGAADDFVDIKLNPGVLIASPDTISIYAKSDLGGSCSSSFISYTYDTTKKDWSLLKTHGASNPGTKYAQSIAIDNKIAIIGEPLFSENGSGQGQVTIYFNSAGETWEKKSSFVPSDISDNDEFGSSLDVYYDTPNDKYYFAISSPKFDHTSSDDNRGKVYIFSYDVSTESLIQERSITAFDSSDNDEAGQEVQLFENTLAFSSTSKDSGKGKVYYYTSTPSNFDFLTERALTHSSEADSGALFGSDIAINNNYILVGSPGNQAAYLYDLNNFFSMQTISKSESSSSDEFGRSVSLNATKVLIGAPGENTKQGKAYLFEISDLDTINTEFSDPALADNNRFGQRLKITSDNKVVISSPGSSSEKGTAYIFEEAGYTSITNLAPFNIKTGNGFGMSIDFSSDDKTLLLGAPANNSSNRLPLFHLYQTP